MSTRAEVSLAYRRRGEVDCGSTALLRADTGVASDGEAAAGCASGTRGTRGCDADLRSHQGVVAQAAVGEGVRDTEEVTVGRGGRGPKPPTS